MDDLNEIIDGLEYQNFMDECESDIGNLIENTKNILLNEGDMENLLENVKHLLHRMIGKLIIQHNTNYIYNYFLLKRMFEKMKEENGDKQWYKDFEKQLEDNEKRIDKDYE